MNDVLLRLEGLTVDFAVGSGTVHAVRGVDLEVHRGEVVGIVGESGSGKSASMLAVLGLLGPNARVGGSVIFDGREVLGARGAAMRSLRGGRIGMVFQDPMTSLNPALTVGFQLAETVEVHQPTLRPKQVRGRVQELLELVAIPNAAGRIHAYPHELSGGMRQRVMIAMALANDPELIIADEPTTALDVTIQAQVLDVLANLRERTRAAMVIITHDLGVVAGVADRVNVMYAGSVVEHGRVEDVFHRGEHPYTNGLLGSVPRLDVRGAALDPIGGVPPTMDRLPAGCSFAPRCHAASDICHVDEPKLRTLGATAVACHLAPGVARIHRGGTTPVSTGDGAPSAAVDTAPLLRVRDLVKEFPARGGRLGRGSGAVQAVAGVSFDLHRGETLSLVGESGCGKSTTARCAVRILEPTSGSVEFDGVDLASLRAKPLRAMRSRFQMVFQDPQASLNPRMTVRDILEEPLRIHDIERGEASERIHELLSLVQLRRSDLDRYPHQFSGGQRQRIGIVRALVLHPEVVALDEPVSALDVSIQAEIVRLLERLREQFGLAYLFIAHDLSVVRHLSDRVAVMYLGKVVESGTNADVYEHAAHPYTQALLGAAPIPDPVVERSRRRIVLAGDPPSPMDPPSGCRFRTRCWKAQERCAEEEPLLADPGIGHAVACHFPEATNVIAVRAADRIPSPHHDADAVSASNRL